MRRAGAPQAATRRSARGNGAPPVNLRKFVAGRRQFVLYCLIGLCGVTLDFVVYAALLRWAGFHPQVANAISYSAGTINNFFLNAAFNFRTRDRLLARFASFYAVGLLG